MCASAREKVDRRLDDDVPSLSFSLGVQELVVPPLDSNHDLENMTDGHVGLLVVSREIDLRRTIRQLKIMFEVPGSVGIQ